MTIEDFLAKLTEAYIEYCDINQQEKWIIYPSNHEFIEGRKYLSFLYTNNATIKDFINNDDMTSLKEYLELQKKEIEDKYGDLSDFIPYFNKKSLNGIYALFNKMYKYHQNISYEDHLKRKSPTYNNQSNLLNDFFPAIKDYNFSSFHKLYVTLDLLYITINALEHLENYEHDMKRLHYL